MEVQSVINESALKEARKYLIKPGIRKISAIASAAFVLLAAYCMLVGRPSTMLLAVFAIVIFNGELKMIESKQIKGFLKKLDELYGKKEVIAPIVFRDADILIQNPLSGGKNAVRYEVMDTLIETEHYFLLFTKEWQITIIAKDGMDSGEKDRFLKMNEEKMPGLKRKYGKK